MLGGRDPLDRCDWPRDPCRGKGGGERQRAQTQEGGWPPAQGRRACSFDSATRQRRCKIKKCILKLVKKGAIQCQSSI